MNSWFGIISECMVELDLSFRVDFLQMGVKEEMVVLKSDIEIREMLFLLDLLLFIFSDLVCIDFQCQKINDLF